MQHGPGLEQVDKMGLVRYTGQGCTRLALGLTSWALSAARAWLCACYSMQLRLLLPGLAFVSWGGSLAQFKKWQAPYASAIPDDVHVKLMKPLTHDVPYVDANDLDARIVTFRPFYFSLGFTF
ncbi:unnamed protein product [Prunus armeniaca]